MKGLRNKNYQKGFSLIELIIAIVILMIVLGAVFTLLQGTIKTANANYETTSAEQNLRYSQEYIGRDVLTVGDGLFGLSNVWLPTRFVTDYLTVRSSTEIDPSNRGFVSVGPVVTDEDIPAGTNVNDSTPATTVLPNSDRITMIALDSEFSPIALPVGSTTYGSGKITVPAARIADFTVGEIYYVSNGASGVFGAVTRIDSGNNQIFWEEGDAFGLNRYGWYGNLATGTRRGNDPANLFRMNIKHYFVDADGRLIRRVFGVKGRAFIDNVVAEHLNTLQFKYILRPSSADTLFNQPVRQVDLSDSTLVRMIEARIKVETNRIITGNAPTEVESIAQLGVRNIQFLEAPVPRDEDGNTDLPNPQPTPRLTPTPTPTPSPTPTPIPTPTPSPTATPTPTPTPTGSPTPTPTPPPTPVPTPTPTPPPPTPTPTPTPRGDG